MKTYKLFLFFLFLGLSASLKAQEFNCEVTVNDDQLEGANLEFLKDLKPQLENYINEYEWTEHDFEERERIKCQLQIILTSSDQESSFGARAIFSTRRPIYNTATETTSILLTDDTWQFNFSQGKSLIHDELQFEALTGFIDFFCYVMLGYDFDSFSDKGGDPYFTQAQNILNLAQTSSAVGWTRATNNRRNRATMITDLLSPSYQALRTAVYRYHRLGLDQFVNNPEKARGEVLTAMENIRDAKRRSTSNYLYDIFFDTKAREIASIFEGAETQIRLEAYNVLQQTDQGHLSEYQKLQ